MLENQRKFLTMISYAKKVINFFLKLEYAAGCRIPGIVSLLLQWRLISF